LAIGTGGDSCAAAALGNAIAARANGKRFLTPPPNPGDPFLADAASAVEGI